MGRCATGSPCKKRSITSDFRILGFTAIVDKQLSAKYESLVNGAPELIKGLPWGKDFEVDVFRKPDFTALEVVSFATGGMSYHPYEAPPFTLGVRHPRRDQCRCCLLPGLWCLTQRHAVVILDSCKSPVSDTPVIGTDCTLHISMFPELLQCPGFCRLQECILGCKNCHNVERQIPLTDMAPQNILAAKAPSAPRSNIACHCELMTISGRCR